MDDILPKLLTFPIHPPPKTPITDQQYDNAIRSQIAVLEKLLPKQLLQSTPGGESILDVIDPALNSVPYLYILNAHCAIVTKGEKNVDLDYICDKIDKFLETFDGRQIRYLGRQLTQLIESWAYIARGARQNYRAIPGIVSAILRTDPSGTMLTSNHLLVVQLALESRVFHTAMPVLDKPVLYFPGTSSLPKPKHLCNLELPPNSFITPTSGLTQRMQHQDVLEYFLYSGMIYMAVENWESALDSLESAVTYPTKENSAVSKIMVEAYKKWILVGLLLKGKALQLPSSTSSAAAKAFHVLGKPYEAVAQMFEQATAGRLKSEIDVGKTIWQNDCNTGLMQHVILAYQEFQIRNLANVYSKISMPEVTSQTQSAETGKSLPSVGEAEQLVQNMIANGTLHAALSHPPNGSSILTFSSTGPILSEKEVKAEMVAATARIQILNKEINRTDRMLTHEKEYIKHAQKLRKGKNGMQSHIVDLEMDWNAEDEQLMGDMY